MTKLMNLQVAVGRVSFLSPVLLFAELLGLLTGIPNLTILSADLDLAFSFLSPFPALLFHYLLPFLLSSSPSTEEQVAYRMCTAAICWLIPLTTVSFSWEREEDANPKHLLIIFF